MVARGEAEIGFQQLSELLPVTGIDIVGLVLVKLQKITVFSAGVAKNAQEPTAAKALIQFLSVAGCNSRNHRKSGMEPA